jgi:prepilin-type N-terminal cleavage/methylation domain-containing protein
MNKSIKPGFTLVEMLVVVSIIAILIVVVFESLDPLRQFKEARNARRWSHVNSISTATYRYIIEKGDYPKGIDEQKRQIGTSNTGCDSNCPGAATSCLDLFSTIVDFLPLMPTESNGGTQAKTGYTISKTGVNNVITVTACSPENGTNIFIMR